MSRVAKLPLKIPAGVEYKNDAGKVSIKGAKATLSLVLPREVSLEFADSTVSVSAESIKNSPALSGTVRATLNNMVEGVTKGYERKLVLVGVGYRASLAGKKLTLNVGLSHPVELMVPEGITIEVPTQTEVLIKGADRQLVGQIAASLRSHRPPEPYKGKGVRYSDETVILKEAKKK